MHLTMGVVDVEWNTRPAPTQAKAVLGIKDGPRHIFQFNPDEVVWDYTNNIFSQDTLGGRVIQLISVSLNSIVVAGRAGSRKELQRMTINMKEIMGYHLHQLAPVEFVVPSRNWHFKVYMKGMPGIGWEISSTSYPYQLNLLVEEDLNGVKTRQINSQVLKRLSSGIGYDYSKEVHGGDALVYKKQFEVLYNSQADGGGIGGGDDDGGGSGGGGGGGGSDDTGGGSGISPKKGHLSIEELLKLASWAISNKLNMSAQEFKKNVITAVAVALCESGGYVKNTSGENTGLWQATPGQNGYSKSRLLTAEGNAMWMAEELRADYNLKCSGSPYKTPSWENAWYCYWGCYRGQGQGIKSFRKDVEKEAKNFDWNQYI